MDREIVTLILAAGKGTRMNSDLPKVLHNICGKPMIQRVIDTSKSLNTKETIVVVGYKAQTVMETIGDSVTFVEQKEQLGTGHAVIQAKDMINNFKGNVLLLYGDTPLISDDTLHKLINYNNNNNYVATVLTANVDNPTGYGRIVRDDDNNVAKIVEHKDCNGEELKINEINSGMYCFDSEFLVNALSKLTNNNSQGEYYITDVIEILNSEGHNVGAFIIDDINEIKGVNTKIHLADAEKYLRKKINEKLMLAGVTIINPSNTYIGSDVKIGKDTVIYPGVILDGHTQIGEKCIIGSNSRLVDTVLFDYVEVQNSTIIQSTIDCETKVGPYAYIRPNCKIGKRVKIGDFVEVKNSTIGDDTKASHLTYIGDAKVGKGVNLGCGVVFVNYDGQKKHLTVVEDDCFVGCNVNLVAPVVIKQGSYIAAGSTITDEVPSNSLAIARSRQTVKEGWVKNNN